MMLHYAQQAAFPVVRTRNRFPKLFVKLRSFHFSGPRRNDVPVLRAQAWVEVALQEWARGLPQVLRQALGRLSIQVLRVIAAGLVLKAEYVWIRPEYVWIRLEPAWQERRTKLLASWKKLTRQEDGGAKGAVGFKTAFDERNQRLNDLSSVKSPM